MMALVVPGRNPQPWGSRETVRTQERRKKKPPGVEGRQAARTETNSDKKVSTVIVPTIR